MDYCTYALESLLKDQKVQQMMEANHLLEESNFIYECVTSGYITLENIEYTPVTEAMLDSLIEFFNKIVDHFKTKAVERSKKYIPWLKEHGAEIKERAAKTGSLKLSPLWEGNWEKDASNIISAIRDGFNSYNAGKYDSYTFTRNFLENSKILTDEGTAVLTDAFKQYYRYGVKRTSRLDDVTVNGAKLAELIDDIIDYLINFDSKVLKNVTRINDELTKLMKTVKTDKPADDTQTPTTDSLSPDTWLSIEQRPVSESMLNVLANYTALTEAEGGTKEKTDDQKKEEETGNVKQVEKVEDPNKPENDKGNKSTNTDEASKYLENVKTFAKFAVSAYQTVLDERYILYINICKTIGDASGSGPKFDKNGNYISKKNQTTTAETTKVESIKDSFTVSSKILGKLRN